MEQLTISGSVARVPQECRVLQAVRIFVKCKMLNSFATDYPGTADADRRFSAPEMRFERLCNSPVINRPIIAARL
jgi:hypothetical protein